MLSELRGDDRVAVDGTWWKGWRRGVPVVGDLGLARLERMSWGLQLGQIVGGDVMMDTVYGELSNERRIKRFLCIYHSI